MAFRHINDDWRFKETPALIDISDGAAWVGVSFEDEKWNERFYLWCGTKGVIFTYTELNRRLARWFLLETEKHLFDGVDRHDAWDRVLATPEPDDEALEHVGPVHGPSIMETVEEE